MRPKARRQWLVNWRSQRPLWQHGALYGGLLLVVCSVGLFAPLVSGGQGGPDADEQCAIVLLWLHEHYWPLVLACAGLVAIGAVRFATRITGPLLRLRRNLRLLADGRLPPPLRLRRGDYLTDEVDSLNAAVAGIAQRVEAIRQAQIAVRREVTAVLDRGVGRGTDRGGDRGDELAALVAACDALDACVRAFRHVDPGDPRRVRERELPQPAPVPSAGSAG